MAAFPHALRLCAQRTAACLAAIALSAALFSAAWAVPACTAACCCAPPSNAAAHAPVPHDGPGCTAAGANCRLAQRPSCATPPQTAAVGGAAGAAAHVVLLRDAAGAVPGPPSAVIPLPAGMRRPATPPRYLAVAVLLR